MGKETFGRTRGRDRLILGIIYISSVHGLVAGRNGILLFDAYGVTAGDGNKGMHRAEVDFLYVCRGYHAVCMNCPVCSIPVVWYWMLLCGEVTGSVIFKNVAD